MMETNLTGEFYNCQACRNMSLRLRTEEYPFLDTEEGESVKTEDLIECPKCGNSSGIKWWNHEQVGRFANRVERLVIQSVAAGQGIITNPEETLEKVGWGLQVAEVRR